jgi:nucleoside-diphosphate-sugar epimerase
MAPSTNRAVVGADGALGALLVAGLGARGIRFRHPSESLDARLPELAEADFVVNASGPRVRPRLGWDDYMREHVGTASAVARAMRPKSHLVHFGSTSVYGARGGVIRADSPEAPMLFPNPSYAWAKLAGEMAVRAICRERGVGLTVLRPAMVYGEGVTSAIDAVASLAKKGIRLDLRPASCRQHCVSSALLVAILERLAERGPQERTFIACDPFVFTNGDLEAAVRTKRSSVALPAPLPWAEAILRRWPIFPDRDVPGALAALAFLGLDNEFDWRGTLSPLGIEPEPFARALTLDPYLEGVL